MINRILIRIKVIQLLYSHLLVEQRFTLETQPTPPTKEKRFAYTLYLETLYMMTRIASLVAKRGGVHPLENRFVKSIASDEKIRSLATRYAREPFPYLPMIDKLVEEIKESDFYKNYCRANSDSTVADVNIWQTIFDKFIIDNPKLRTLSEGRENYSPRSFDRCREMMHTTFRNFLSSQGNIPDAVKVLHQSLDKARELYFRLLNLPVELTRLQEQLIDEAKHKYIPTEEDLYPNLRFVENALVAALADNEVIKEYVETNKCSWLSENPVMMNSLLKSIKESDIYQEYMSFPVTDFKTDCNFWRDLFKQIVFSNDTFLEALEDQSIFWNDDLEVIGSFLLKTIKKIEEGTPVGSAIMDMYKDEEDARFGAELFTCASSHKNEYLGIINKHVNTASWDTDRLAFMDVVILIAALAELLNFPKIPANVTINEYIELAKSYSTANSGNFVNGILGSIITDLRKERRLMKD